MSNRVILKAPAKINWVLEVLRKRPDGYHDLSLVYQTVGLFDEVKIQTADGFSLELSENVPGLTAGEENLMLRAARAFAREAGIREGVRLVLKKNIPLAAGLGGGSSDAAVVLCGMNHLFGHPLSKERLFEIAASLGADVPFFLLGGCAHGMGKGDELTAWRVKTPAFLTLVKPAEGLSTAAVYASSRKIVRGAPGDLAPLREALSRGDWTRVGALLRNDLQPAAEEALPVIGEAVEALRRLGALGVCVSGSGPTVFALWADAASAERAAKELEGDFAFCRMVETLGPGEGGE